MDVELWELQKELERVQEESTVQRLSERNVVDLVEKLRKAGKLSVFHTLTGKEYITPAKVEEETRREISFRGGRARVDEIAATLNVDFSIAQNAFNSLLENFPTNFFALSQIEIVSDTYINQICREINEAVQETGKLSIGSIASQFQLPMTHVRDWCLAHKNTLIFAEIKEGWLFTERHNLEVTSQVRGALAALTRPTPLATLCTNLSLAQEDLERAISQLDKQAGGTVRGKIQNGTFVPFAFAYLQRQSVDALFSSNGVLTFEMARKLEITKNIGEFVRESFQDAHELDSCVVSAAIVQGFKASLTDCVASSSFLDIRSVVPIELTEEDCLILLREGSQQSVSGEKKRPTQPPSTATLFCGHFLVSVGLITLLKEQVTKEGMAAGTEAAKSKPETFTVVGSSSVNSHRSHKKHTTKQDAGAEYLEQVLEEKSSIEALSELITKSVPPLGQEEYVFLLDSLAEQLVPDFRSAFKQTYLQIESSVHLSAVASDLHRADLLEAVFEDKFNLLQLYTKGMDRVTLKGTKHLELRKVFLGLVVLPVFGILVDRECIRDGIQFIHGSTNALENELFWNDLTTCQNAIHRLAKRDEKELLDAFLSIAQKACNNEDIGQEDAVSFESMCAQLTRIAKECSFVARKLDKKTERSLATSHRQRVLSWLVSSNTDSQIFAYAVALILQQCSNTLIPVPSPPGLQTETPPPYGVYVALEEQAKNLLPEDKANDLTAIVLCGAAVDPHVLDRVRIFASEKNPAAT